MKLEFKKKENITIKIQGKKVSVRPYLSHKDIITATELALQNYSVVQQNLEINRFAVLPNAKVAYDIFVLNQCTDIEIDDNDIEEVIASGIIDEISPYVYNYKATLEMIYLATLNQTIYSCLNTMANSIPTDEKMKSTISDMSGLLQELNKNPEMLKKVFEIASITQIKADAKKEIKAKKKE